MSDKERLRRLGLEGVPEKDLPDALRHLESEINARRDLQAIMHNQSKAAKTQTPAIPSSGAPSCKVSPAGQSPARKYTFGAFKRSADKPLPCDPVAPPVTATSDALKGKEREREPWEPSAEASAALRASGIKVTFGRPVLPPSKKPAGHTGGETSRMHYVPLRSKVSRAAFLLAVAITFVLIHFSSLIVQGGVRFAKVFSTADGLAQLAGHLAIYVAELVIPALLVALVVPALVRWVKSGD